MYGAQPCLDVLDAPVADPFGNAVKNRLNIHGCQNIWFKCEYRVADRSIRIRADNYDHASLLRTNYQQKVVNISIFRISLFCLF